MKGRSIFLAVVALSLVVPLGLTWAQVGAIALLAVHG
jgi:hypothetical protein